MRIDLLCSGSKGNCCLVRATDTQIVIDCGSTKRYLTQSLQAVGAQIGQTDAILLTHSHSDHVSQRKLFAQIPMYSYCEVEGFERHTHVEPLEQFRIRELSIRLIPLSHDAPKTAGYVISDGEQTLVYITDTGYIANSNKPYLKNADYYIFESNHDVPMLMGTSRPLYLKQRILSPSGHLNNEDSAKNLTELVGENTTDIVLAHLSQEANTPELALKALHACFARKQIPTDGMQIRAAEQFQIETIERGSCA